MDHLELNNKVKEELNRDKAALRGTDEYREFKYGHLMFECYRCSHRETIEKDVKDGISIMLPTTNKHEWSIVCPRCQNKMRFFFVESFKKDDEVIVEEAPKKKTKRKNKSDESKEVNKEEGSV